MTGRKRRWGMRAIILAVALMPLGLVGCFPWGGGIAPFSAGLATPIPVPPWVSTKIEERLQNKNDFRTAILPPVRPGFPDPKCEDPPDDASVLRALKQVARGVPYIYEEHRDDIQIVTEKLVDKIDPPRFYPLVGWARLHHCHYKSTVYFTETIWASYPFPYHVRKPRVEVVYIDKDHLHLHPGGTPEANQSVTRDLSGF